MLNDVHKRFRKAGRFDGAGRVTGKWRFFHPGSHVSVLSGVSLALHAGQIVCIRGCNGSGKSTLLKICAGTLTPDRGEVHVLGQRCSHRSRQAIGVCGSEERGFFLRLTARQNLGFHAQLFGVASRLWRPRLGALSERLMVERLLDVPMAELSSGVKQRFALIRALLHDPQFLLLDEAFAHQDEQGIATFEAILEEAARSGKGVLHALHGESVLRAHASYTLESGSLSPTHLCMQTCMQTQLGVTG
jgi:ABC-2 type transport system ATP-binding protein